HRSPLAAHPHGRRLDNDVNREECRVGAVCLVKLAAPRVEPRLAHSLSSAERPHQERDRYAASARSRFANACLAPRPASLVSRPPAFRLCPYGSMACKKGFTGRTPLSFTRKPTGDEGTRVVKYLDYPLKPGVFRAFRPRWAWDYPWLRVRRVARGRTCPCSRP